MKQLLVMSSVLNAYTALPAKNAGLFTKVGTNTAITEAITGDFSIIVGKGTDKMPINIPEVNFDSLCVHKTTYAAASAFKAQITLKEPVTSGDYTVIVVKKGTTINERYKYTYTVPVEAGEEIDSVHNKLVTAINNNSQVSGVTAEVTGVPFEINGTDTTTDYNVVLADDASDGEVTITPASKGSLTPEYIKDLAEQCQGDRGYVQLSEDGKEIYPGYNDYVNNGSGITQPVMYTLRFAVPRAAAKQRDEVVWQVVHIITPTNLDTFFGSKLVVQ